MLSLSAGYGQRYGELILLSTKWAPIAVAALVLAVTWAYGRLVFRKKLSLSKIPVVGAETGDAAQQRMAFVVNAKKLVDEGYKKFRNSCFRVYTTSKSYMTTPHHNGLSDVLRLRFRCGCSRPSLAGGAQGYAGSCHQPGRGS